MYTFIYTIIRIILWFSSCFLILVALAARLSNKARATNGIHLNQITLMQFLIVKMILKSIIGRFSTPAASIHTQ